MTKDLWLNLPVKDINKAKEFYKSVGFTFHDDSPGNTPVSAPMVVSAKNGIVMLFQEAVFATLVGAKVEDLPKGNEILISLGVDSREEVDSIQANAEAAGAKIFGRAGENNGMYGCGFTDIDGHKWNVLHMNW